MKNYCLILLLALALPVGLGATDAQAAYAKGCKGCHGPQGLGNPAVAKMMNVTLPNLQSREIQARSDAEIRKIATEGKGKMKPVKTLAPGEIDAAIAYLRTLGK